MHAAHAHQDDEDLEDLSGHDEDLEDLSGHVDEGVDVVIVPLHVLVLNQPLYLLLDQFLAWKEHVL